MDILMHSPDEDFDLFDPPAPFKAGSDTSAAAANDIESSAPRMRQRIAEFLAGRGSHGATDEEIQKALNMPGNTERPRRVELLQRRLVLDTGMRRQTSAGRYAAVWAVTNLYQSTAPKS